MMPGEVTWCIHLFDSETGERLDDLRVIGPNDETQMAFMLDALLTSREFRLSLGSENIRVAHVHIKLPDLPEPEPRVIDMMIWQGLMIVLSLRGVMEYLYENRNRDS